MKWARGVIVAVFLDDFDWKDEFDFWKVFGDSFDWKSPPMMSQIFTEDFSGWP